MTLPTNRLAAVAALRAVGCAAVVAAGLLPAWPALAQPQRLNDTGLTACYTDQVWSGFVSATTPNAPAGFEGQDCVRGATAADALGRMVKVGGSTIPGRDYTKIANNGSVLPADAPFGSGPTDWACTRDNITGLIWELKTNDGGLRDEYWTYTWYDADPAVNGGVAGAIGTGTTCGEFLTNCNTTAYRDAINALPARLCGATDWRLPTVQELSGLVYIPASFNPAYDLRYFPHTGTSAYWSGQSKASVMGEALRVEFFYGRPSFAQKALNLSVRLVRGGQ